MESNGLFFVIRPKPSANSNKFDLFLITIKPTVQGQNLYSKKAGLF